MNTLQKIILMAGAAALAAAAAVPPWTHVRGFVGTYGYSFILKSPNQFATINWGRLLVEWVAIVGITTALAIAASLRDSRPAGRSRPGDHRSGIAR